MSIQPSPPLSSPSRPALNCSQHQGLSNESVLCIRWPKYLSFSFRISPFNEYSGLISFRIDSFDPLEVQETLKSLLQHWSSKASILWHSVFFTVQLLHPYMTTGPLLAKWKFFCLICCMFNMVAQTLSRFFRAFLPRSKRLLISWLQSLSTVLLQPKKRKSVTASMFSPSICQEVMPPDATILVFWMLSFKPAFSVSNFHPHQEALAIVTS